MTIPDDVKAEADPIMALAIAATLDWWNAPNVDGFITKEATAHAAIVLDAVQPAIEQAAIERCRVAIHMRLSLTGDQHDELDAILRALLPDRSRRLT